LLEAAANAMATVSILLAGRNSVHTWWTGIVGCALFAVVFWSTQLYADVALQLFFIGTSLSGWWHWRERRDHTHAPIQRVAPRALAGMALAAAVAALAYGALLHRFTDAYAPFADSAVLSLSVLAQLLLMRRRLETWPVWLLVNTIAVPLYASRGLTITAILYAVYWVNAIVSWRHWSREASAVEATA
jgi:nicotinamide mononucleotide transporter